MTLIDVMNHSVGILYRDCEAFHYKRCYEIERIAIGCIINLNKYNCTSLKNPCGWFLTSAHLTIKTILEITTDHDTELIVYYRCIRQFSSAELRVVG